MVRKLKRFIFCSLFTVHCSLILAGCAATGKEVVTPDFRPIPDQGIAYVIPFFTTLVPEAFNEKVFNTFVDTLNANHEATDVRWFYIVKEEFKDLDPAWLAKQLYMTGEIWSYIEDIGCCSAELRINSRLRIYEAGKAEPAMEFLIPRQRFFDKDKSTLEAERELLALDLANDMAVKIINVLAKQK
jgi:hypothetical protein